MFPWRPYFLDRRPHRPAVTTRTMAAVLVLLTISPPLITRGTPIDCTFDHVTTAVIGSSSPNSSKPSVNISLHDRLFSAYKRHLVKYCQIEKPKGAEISCTGQSVTRNFTDGFVFLNLDTAVYALRLECGFRTDQTPTNLDRSLITSDRSTDRSLTPPDHFDQSPITWTRSPYKILDLLDFDGSASATAFDSNRSKLENLYNAPAFLEPDKTWKTSERSSIVILVIGASAIAAGLPFALYIACRRKKEERRRTISLVTGAMR